MRATRYVAAAHCYSAILENVENWKILVTRVKRNFKSFKSKSDDGRRCRCRIAKSSSPPAATAPHLAGVAAIKIVKDRDLAAGVPVAGNQGDPLARHPAEAGWRACRKARAVDDER